MSTGSGLAMSTPASRSRSSGSLEQPAWRNPRYSPQFLVPAVEHALGERDGGRQAGRVLVDVEGPVEVRNPQALERQLLVDHEIGSEVGLQQFAVDVLETPGRSAVHRVPTSSCVIFSNSANIVCRMMVARMPSISRLIR